MSTKIQPITRSRSLATPAHQLRKLTGAGSVTLFGLIILLAFLLPLGYMSVTSLKSLKQIQDPHSQFLPSSPVTVDYAGKQLPLLNVPMPDGSVRQLALLTAGREDSQFLDPANLEAEPIQWVGRWRVLDAVYRTDPTYDNFPLAWNQIKFGLLFRNTFIIAISGTIGTLLSSIVVAYGFARFRIPGINVIFLVLMATIILPSEVTLIPTYVFFRLIGWGGTWWPLIIPHFFANAYNVFLLRQYFRGIPKDLDEAAAIDGASPLRILLNVIIPQSWPALTAVAMFHFFFAWNDFFKPLVYLQGREELYPISVALTQFNNIYATQPGILMAAAIMAIALPVVIFFLAQRQFMQGIVITGVDK